MFWVSPSEIYLKGERERREKFICVLSRSLDARGSVSVTQGLSFKLSLRKEWLIPGFTKIEGS